MCYDKEYQLQSQLKRAYHSGMDESAIQKLIKEIETITGRPVIGNDIDEMELPGYFHVSGFAHPPMIVYPSLQPQKAAVAEWGFVPNWVKKKKEAYDPASPYNNNLNAQSQTMFEKRAFGKAARYGRCVVQIDAYYESHHYKGKTYPFRIYKKDGSPMLIAAICRKARFVDEETGEEIVKNVLATLTCEANDKLAKIHNNPTMLKRGNGHRMLVILDEEQTNQYLQPYPTPPGQQGDPAAEKLFQDEIKHLCTAYPSELLDFHSVRNLRDRKDYPYIGNVPEIREEFIWPEMDYARVSP